MKLKEFFQNKAWKKWDKSQWTILILTGILLMILAIPTGSGGGGEAAKKEETKQEEKSDDSSEADYVDKLEEKLEDTLSEIDGAGRVRVMITLEDSGESIVEKDDTKESSDTAETDSAGGSRSEKRTDTGETTVYQEEDDRKVPFVGREMTPKIAGILVVAQGGENTQVKQNISEAVMALFQIDVNRIKVVKMNIQEEEY